MISEVCRWYGWTMEYVLQMPAVSFYAFLKQCRIELGREGVHSADLSVIPKMEHSYYLSLRKSYQELMRDPIVRERATAEQRLAAYSWDDPTAQAMIQTLFRQHRKSHYGH